MIIEDKKIKNGCTFLSGFAFKSSDFSDEGTSVIKIANIQNKVVRTTDSQKLPLEKISQKLDKFQLEDGDVLIAMTGQGSVGRVGKLILGKGEKALLNQRVGKFICDEKNLHKDFLYYVISSKEYEKYLFDLALGSGQPNLSPNDILNVEIPFPEYPTQRRIAEILSALDDKIELNRRMNQTLEQMAQTLFRQYFVDSIDEENLPKGWREGKLSEVLELVYGKALKQGDRKGGEYPVVGSSGIVGYHNSYIAEGKGIVVGRKGNAGAVIWLDQKFYPIDTTYYVVDQLQVEDLYFHYFLLKSLPLAGMNSDSAVPGLNRNDAYNIDILIPSRESIIDFNKKIRSLFDQKYTKEKEITTLTQLRDTLLPKLMSGEIDVMQTKPDELHEPVLS